MVEFDHLLNKEKVEDNDKLEDIVNKKSRFETNLLVERNLEEINEKESIQLERRGYFYIDKLSSNSDKKSTILHFIPDGKSKSMSIIGTKVDPKATSGIKDDVKKSKKQLDREKKKENEKNKPKKELTEEDKKKAEEAKKKKAEKLEK